MRRRTARLFIIGLETLKSRSASEGKLSAVFAVVSCNPLKSLVAFFYSPVVMWRLTNSIPLRMRKTAARVCLISALAGAYVIAMSLGNLVRIPLLLLDLGDFAFIGTCSGLLLGVTFAILILDTTAPFLIRSDRDEITKLLRAMI
jgi:hypothetical protein